MHAYLFGINYYSSSTCILSTVNAAILVMSDRPSPLFCWRSLLFLLFLKWFHQEHLHLLLHFFSLLFFLFFHRFIVTDKILTISCDSVHTLHTLTHRQKRKMNDGAGYNCRVWSTCPKSREHGSIMRYSSSTFCCPGPNWAPLLDKDTTRGWRAT